MRASLTVDQLRRCSIALFFLLASSALGAGGHYELLPPHVPAAKIVELTAPDPPQTTHTFSALDTNNAFTGNNTCKNQEGVRCIDSANAAVWTGSDLAAWVSSAFSNCGTSVACTVFVSNGTYATPSASISVGNSPCASYPGKQAQTLIFDTNVQMTINNPILVLCGGALASNGQNTFAGWITAGSSLPAGPMIDIGDATNGNINASVSYMRLNCNGITGCVGIRARGIQDNSVISNNVIQNNLGTGINIDCSTAAGGGDFFVSMNNIAISSSASAQVGISLNNCSAGTLIRNTVVNNGATQQAAGIYVTGATNNSTQTIVGQHCEQVADCIKLDANQSVSLTGIDATNNTTNVLHLTAAAGGNVDAHMLGNNNTSNNVIKNDVTGTTLTANNPPTAFGIIPYYSWTRSSTSERWQDNQGWHERQGIIANSYSLTGSGNLLISSTAPTVSSGFNAGSVGTGANGPASFFVNVGTGTAGSTGVIGLPTATNGWNCYATNQTRAAQIQQTTNSTASATLTNFGTTFAATNWTNSDVLLVTCFAR